VAALYPLFFPSGAAARAYEVLESESRYPSSVDGS